MASNKYCFRERGIISSTGSKVNHAQLWKENQKMSVSQSLLCFRAQVPSPHSTIRSKLCPAPGLLLCALHPAKRRNSYTAFILPPSGARATALSSAFKTKNNQDQGLETSCIPKRLLADSQ